MNQNEPDERSAGAALEPCWQAKAFSVNYLPILFVCAQGYRPFHEQQPSQLLFTSTLILRGFALSFFGRVTVSTPFL
jgi:hypothetical protein